MDRRLVCSELKVLFTNKQIYFLWFILYVFTGAFLFSSTYIVADSINIILDLLELDLFMWVIIGNIVLASNSYLYTANYYKLLRINKKEFSVSRFVLFIVTSFFYISVLFLFIFVCVGLNYNWFILGNIVKVEIIKLAYLYIRYLLIAIFIQVFYYYLKTTIPQINRNMFFVFPFILFVFLSLPNGVLTNCIKNPIIQLDFSAVIIMTIDETTKILPTILFGNIHLVGYIAILICIYMEFSVKKVEFYEQ